MGIQNLLPFVKKACRQGYVSEFAGCSIAVDVSCLLHRGLFGCASDVAQGVTTDFYVRYVMKYVKTLTAIGCHVVLVFDGQPLPAKKDTNECRREKRDQQKRMGEQLLSEGKKSEAHECFKRSTTITSEVVENTIEAFQGMKMVDVLVAPYESDAQLAFLANTGKVQAVVTEDSDLIAFGCEKIIFKMEHSGSCLIYEQKNLPKCLGKALAENFDFSKFRRICILAGCDYLQSGLPGVGLSKAATFFAKTSGTNLYQVLPRLPRYLNMNSLKIKKEFIDDFIRAENTFLYQIVFDPTERRQRPLNNYPQSDDDDGNFEEDDFVGVTMMDEKQTDYSYAGDLKPSTLALRLALGNRLDYGNPSLCDKFVLPSEIPEWSIWSPKFESGEIRKRKKKEVEEISKNECGAFTLSAGVRKIRKEFTSTTTSSTAEDEEITVLDSPAASSEGGGSSSQSSEGDSDFVKTSKPAACKTVSSTAVQSSNIKSFFTCKQRPNVFANSSSLSLKQSSTTAVSTVKTVSSVSLKKGNGIRQNWNCDDLLKLYALDSKAIASDASPTSSQESPVRSKRPAVSVESDSENTEDSEEISVCEVKLSSTVVNSENANEEKAVTALSSANNTESFSGYFLNRGGVRTSGLSRRSANPFKKAKLSTGDSVQSESNISSECDNEKVRVASPLLNQSNLEGSAVRISGLRRVVSAKEI